MNHKLWGGRFNEQPAEIMLQINSSIPVDRELAYCDIRGSLAHVAMLAQCGIISPEEAEKIAAGLQLIELEWQQGKMILRDELEDVHTHNEQRLAELIGPLAGKLHTARSRNDQVALDLRLWVRDTLGQALQLLRQLQQALLQRAEGEVETVMPGFTHLQVAQPVNLAHYLLAYVDMFARDENRAWEALYRLDACPLGAGALAGTSFPIDRFATARALGFSQPTSNSIDSVSDRDFACDFLYFSSLCVLHLSRLAEELVIWSSQQFGFIRLSDALTTGSSIMPQKRNPDAAELVRGKSGPIFASLQSLLVTLKGLPLAYAKDMQEDKEPVFACWRHLSLCLRAMRAMVLDFEVDRARLLQAAGSGFSTATDLADQLVQQTGVPFRQAHHLVGQLIRLAEQRGCGLSQLDLREAQQLVPELTAPMLSRLDVRASVASRNSYGGTGALAVQQQLLCHRQRLRSS